MPDSPFTKILKQGKYPLRTVLFDSVALLAVGRDLSHIVMRIFYEISNTPNA